MQIKTILLLILLLILFSCNKNSNPVSTQTLRPHFVLDSLNIIANPDSVHSKLVYHFEGASGYLTYFYLEVYYSGIYEAYGIKPNNPIDTAGVRYTKYKSFKLYYTPANGFTTYRKCKISGNFVNLTDSEHVDSEPFTWFDSSSVNISK